MLIRTFIFNLLSTELFLSSTALAAAAGGSERPVLEEMVVTAEFGAPTLYTAPTSATVLRPNAARHTSTNHLEELLGWIPNANFSSGGSRARFPQLRGIGERGQFVEPLNPSVGLLLDGVDLSGFGTVAGLYDIQQVEVLRGPQGTLYGANALAGLISVSSVQPGDHWESRIDLDAGDYDARGLGLASGGPIGDGAGLRLSGRHYEDDGFMTNRFLGRADTDRHKELTLRGTLTVDLASGATLALAAGHSKVDNGYDAFSLENDRNTRADEPGRDAQNTSYLSGRYATALSAAGQLQLTVAYAHSASDYGYDEDWTFVGFHPLEYSATDRYQRRRDTLTADARWRSAIPLRLGPLRSTWVVGVYALIQDTTLDRDYTFAAPFDSEFEIDRLAVYGEFTTTLNDRTRLRTGLRFERHDASYNDSAAVTFDPSNQLWGGRLVLEHDLDPAHLLYGSLSRGYKAGAFNTDGSLDADLRQYDPETLLSLEVGLKGRWLDSRLGLRGAAFWMERPDMQVSTSLTRLRPNGSSEFIDYTDNAADGSNRGVELELDFAASATLDLFAAIGLLDTELKDYINGSGDQLEGRDQAQAPHYTYFLGGEWSPAPGWFGRLELEGKDSYFTSDSHSVRAPSYRLFNVSVGYGTERWQVKFWSRNLTDEDVVVRGFFFPNDPRTGYSPAEPYRQLGEPRRAGLSLTARL